LGFVDRIIEIGGKSGASFGKRVIGRRELEK
jgi:hypothetical protein